MATVTVGGQVSTFGRNIAEIVGVRLFFIPPTPGFVYDGATHSIMSDKWIPATIAGDGTGRFTAELEPVANIRPPLDKQGRPWGYGIRVEIPDPNAFGPDRGYLHLDLPDFRVYVTAGGGSIGPMIAAPIRYSEVWITTPGVIPPGALPGDLIFNHTEGHLGRIA